MKLCVAQIAAKHTEDTTWGSHVTAVGEAEGGVWVSPITLLRLPHTRRVLLLVGRGGCGLMPTPFPGGPAEGASDPGSVYAAFNREKY
jgi:hypothetical protein